MADETGVSLHELSPFVHMSGQFRMLPGFRRAPWFTPEHHLIHVLDGGCCYRVGDRTHRLLPGDVLLIAPGVWTQSWNPSEETMHYHSVHFDLRYEGDYATLPVSFQDDVPENRARVHAALATTPALRLPIKSNLAGQPQLRPLLDRIVRETAEKRPGYELATKAAMLEILLLLHRGPTDESDEMGPAVEAIRRAVRFLEANFARSLTLEDIARAAHLSPIYFGRVFKRATARTPMSYLRCLRMDRAKQLLVTDELSIAQVADAVGFADPYHFSRVFRRHEGVAPSQYRELARQWGDSIMPTAENRSGGYDSFSGVGFYSIPPVERG